MLKINFMKKLSKIKLHDAVVLENQEMKMIFGGSGGVCDPYAINCGRNLPDDTWSRFLHT